MTPKDYAALIHTLLIAYDNGARQTGRTTRLLRACNDGDVVVCPNQTVAYHITHAAKAMNKDVTAVVNDYHLGRLHERLGPVNTVHFEHTWIEGYFKKEATTLARCLTEFQKEHNERAAKLKDLPEVNSWQN